MGELHPHLVPFAVAVTSVIIFSLQTTQTAAKLKVGEQKVSQLHFYFHDKVRGQNVTAVPVAAAPSTHTSPTFFGAVYVIDDLLTEGPDPSSKVVGRAQGLYALAGQKEMQLLMAVTYVFQSGEFNGSTLCVVGNNPVFNEEREMPVVGGSRKFRVARGFALARTHSFDLSTGNAIVQYNVTVLHY